jgi:hypothetical protein
MSWTIQTTAPENPDMKNLHDAINRAHTAHILMFCSASDQGGHTPERSFPGDWNQCLRIGGATFAGDKLTWVDDKVDFWFPGRNGPFPSNDGKTVAYESSSSVATAAASGLAAVLIYTTQLMYGNDDESFQDRNAPQNAFGNMASGSDNKFPRRMRFWVPCSRRSGGRRRYDRTSLRKEGIETCPLTRSAGIRFRRRRSSIWCCIFRYDFDFNHVGIALPDSNCGDKGK